MQLLQNSWPAPRDRFDLGQIEMARRTPGRLAEYATDKRRYRTNLWLLFDRIALCLISGVFSSALIMCPPQHGKSEFWSKYFPAWYLGHNPNHRIVLGAYGAQFASGWGRATRDTIRDYGEAVFNVGLRDDVAAANEWKTVDPKGEKLFDGGMVTAGIEGGIAGRPAELAIADDLISDDDAGMSLTIKDKVWNWWENEMCARLQKGGRRVMLMTRRAEDDPIGRIMKLVKEKRETFEVFKLPAIAEEDECFEFPEIVFKGVTYPAYKWTRKAGEALCPELHDLPELEATKKAVGEHSQAWSGLRQQLPVARGGGDFKGEWFKIVGANPVAHLKVRAWDLAYSTKPTAKRTAGCLMSKYRDGESNRYHIEDFKADRWGPGDRNKMILEQAKADGKNVHIVLEEEPGSGGPTQIDELTRLLDGFSVTRTRAATEGSKMLRADPMMSQAEVGSITMLDAPWNSEFRNEVNGFPTATLKDMVDAGAHAYNWLSDQPSYDTYSEEQVVGPEKDPVFDQPQGGVFG